MKVVLDTGVYLRGLLNPRSSAGQALQTARDECTVLLSLELLREIVGVFGREELRERFPSIAQQSSRALLASIFLQAEFAELKANERERVCRDPNDDKLFWCAVSGGARYIVSEDKDVLAVGDYRGIRTITSAQFVRLIEEDTSP